MTDYAPPETLWLIPIIAAYLLLENKQARGRHYFSRAMTALHTFLGGGHDR